MSNWTDWRKLAEKNKWFNDELDYDGPSCYELGIGGPNGGNIQPKYVGETKDEKKRMSQYAANGSHLGHLIDDALRRGWSLYYRGQAMKSKADAKKMQDNLLSSYLYDWNTQLNEDDDD